MAGIGNYLTGYDGEAGAQVYSCAALSLDTKLPTPSGWTTVGQVSVRNKLFDENGNICNVTYVTPVIDNHKCYRVIFDDGSQIIADAGHLWQTRKVSGFEGNSGSVGLPKLRCEDGRKAVFSLHNKKYYVCTWKDADKDKKFKIKLNEELGKRPIRKHIDTLKTGVRTTEEIFNTLKTGWNSSNHFIPIAGMLDTDETALELAPYTLGAWLGDGTSTRGSIGTHKDDREIPEHIERDGYSLSYMKPNQNMISFTVLDIRKHLRHLDLISNKHIPQKYLRASISQRLQLLRGLMDTDGTCTKIGECRITSSIPRLANDIHELILSLGFKAKVNIYKTSRKDSYSISFKAYSDNPVFNLTRKRDRQIDRPGKPSRNLNRSIVDVVEIDSVPVKCIEVDSPNHLFLASESMIATHNTKREQARAIHKPAIRMVKASPALRRKLNTLRDNIHCMETGSKFEPLSGESKTEDGLNVHGSLVDEYHAHPDSGMYDVLRSGMGSRKQPITYVITTAGFEKNCPCYEMRGDICTILENYDDQNINDDSVFGIIYTIDNEDDWMDESCWIKANPNLNVSVYLEDMRIMFETAKRVPSKQNDFKTKKLNIWTEAETLWITSDSWALNNHAVSESGLHGHQCYGGLDLSTSHDITAWVKCFPPLTPDDKYKFLYDFYIPQDDLHERVMKDKVAYDVWINQGFVTATPGGSVNYDYIIEQIRKDSELYSLDQILYDPWNASYVTTILEADNFPLVTFAQSMGSYNAASKDFEKRVLDGELAHANNPVMNWMMGCTSVKQDSAGNIRPVKPDRGKTNKRIDGVVASIMALDGAVRNCAVTESIYNTRGLLSIDLEDDDD